MKQDAGYRVLFGAFDIFCGIPKGIGKSGNLLWSKKSKCTRDAIYAVRDYLKHEADGLNLSRYGYEWTSDDGNVVRLVLEIEEDKAKRVPEGNMEVLGDMDSDIDIDDVPLTEQAIALSKRVNTEDEIPEELRGKCWLCVNRHKCKERRGTHRWCWELDKSIIENDGL